MDNFIATLESRESVANANMQQMGANIEQVRRSKCTDISKFKSENGTSQRADGIRLELEQRLHRLATDHSSHEIEIELPKERSEKALR